MNNRKLWVHNSKKKGDTKVFNKRRWSFSESDKSGNHIHKRKKKKLNNDKKDSSEFDIKILPDNNSESVIRITQVSVKKGGDVTIDIIDDNSNDDDLIPSPEHVPLFYQSPISSNEDDTVSFNDTREKDSEKNNKQKSYDEYDRSYYSPSYYDNYFSYGKSYNRSRRDRNNKKYNDNLSLDSSYEIYQISSDKERGDDQPREENFVDDDLYEITQSNSDEEYTIDDENKESMPNKPSEIENVQYFNNVHNFDNIILNPYQKIYSQNYYVEEQEIHTDLDPRKHNNYNEYELCIAPSQESDQEPILDYEYNIENAKHKKNLAEDINIHQHNTEANDGMIEESNQGDSAKENESHTTDAVKKLSVEKLTMDCLNMDEVIENIHKEMTDRKSVV